MNAGLRGFLKDSAVFYARTKKKTVTNHRKDVKKKMQIYLGKEIWIVFDVFPTYFSNSKYQQKQRKNTTDKYLFHLLCRSYL